MANKLIVLKPENLRVTIREDISDFEAELSVQVYTVGLPKVDRDNAPHYKHFVLGRILNADLKRIGF